MKKITILLMLLCFITISKSQNFESIYLGQNFIHYKGSFLMIESKTTLSFGNMFYDDIKNNDDNVIYPDSKYKWITIKDSLLNKVFIVLDIIDKDGNPFFILKDTFNKNDNLL